MMQQSESGGISRQGWLCGHRLLTTACWRMLVFKKREAISCHSRKDDSTTALSEDVCCGEEGIR